VRTLWHQALICSNQWVCAKQIKSNAPFFLSLKSSYLEKCGISSGEISASSPHTLRLIAEANQLAKKRKIEKIQQEQMASEEGIPAVTGVDAANAVAPGAVHDPKIPEKDRKGHKDAKSTTEVAPESHKQHSKKTEKDAPMDMMGESKEPSAEELELVSGNPFLQLFGFRIPQFLSHTRDMHVHIYIYPY
jgi:hypothetical protein